VTKAAPKRAGFDEILYPGELSQRLQREGLASGTVRIPAPHFRAIVKLATELDLQDAFETNVADKKE
jgi:hypothetical protein